MGKVYTTVDVQSDHVLVRGGSWGNASSAGSFALALD